MIDPGMTDAKSKATSEEKFVGTTVRNCERAPLNL